MRRYFILGLVLWFVATVVLRLIGQVFFASPLAIVLTYLVSAGILLLALQGLFLRIRMSHMQRLQAILSLALPGMVLDVLSITFVSTVFPNLPDSAHPAFAGWLLWAYSLVLLIALLPARVSSEA